MTQTIKEHLKLARTTAGFTIKDIARILDVSYQYVHALENPNMPSHNISLEKAIILADEYGISLDKLIGRSIPEKKKD